MGHNFSGMRTRYVAHTTAPDCCRRQRNPSSDFIHTIQTPVSQILMPTHIVRRIRFLNKQVGPPNHNISTQYCPHRVQYRRKTGNLIYERHHHIGVTKHKCIEVGVFVLVLTLRCFELTAIDQRLFDTHRINREVVAVLVIAVGNRRQFIGHLINLLSKDVRFLKHFQFHIV